MTAREPPLYVVNGLLAAGVLYWVLDLSRAGRGTVDWIVVSLVVLAVLWNVVRLSRLLHAAHGLQGVWHVLRTVLFWIVGSQVVDPRGSGLAGGWRTWIGLLVLAFAILDTIALFRKERRLAAGTQPAH